MGNSSPLRIALCCDRPDWILGEIARNVQKTLSSKTDRLAVKVFSAPQTSADLMVLEKESDVIHFLSPWDFKRLGNLVRKPVVVTYHHLVDWGLFDEFHSRADAICTTNNQLRAQLLSRMLTLSGKLFVTPYGLDPGEFRPILNSRSHLLARAGLCPESILIGFSGKKSSDQKDRKGTDRLWIILSALRDRYQKRVHLLISGEGWTPDMVPENLKDQVSFLGFQPSGELPGFYAGLDYYFCLSRIEGGPYPVMEAMACETKVISTPVGIVPEIVVDGVNGFIVPQEDHISRILEIVEKWTADTPQSSLLRRAARKTIVEKCSWEQTASPALYEQIYQEAVRHWRKKRAIAPALLPWLKSLGRKIQSYF